MTRHDASPPPIAEWLVSLLATPEQKPAILGDLLEEFSATASRLGVASARRWYWRHSVRTVAHLLRGQLQRAPAETVAMAIGGFLLYVLVERALQMSAQALVGHSNVYDQVSADTYWWTIDHIARYLVPVIIGWTIARTARGREIMAVLSIGATETIWIVAVYASWLLTAAGMTQMTVPAFSMASVFCPPASGPPHAGSVMNTLTLLRFTIIHWWMPMFVALLTGAVIRRTSSSSHPAGREMAR